MVAQVSVAVWNVFQGLHHTARPGRRVMNEAMVEAIASLDADVLVLPELWAFSRPNATLAEDTAATLGYELHQWVSDRPSRARETVPWRMAVLTRIPARAKAPIEMPEFGNFGRRAAVSVHLTDVDVTVAGLHLYGIHLLLDRDRKAWRREREYLRKIASSHDIVAGDFNMWSPPVHRDAKPLRPAIKGRTYHASRPHSQIDHIMVSEHLDVLRAERFPDMGSDHRALRVELRTRRV